MKTVLVTGATGYIGSHILEEFRDDPRLRVIAACRRPEHLPDWFDGEVRVGDLTDQDHLRTLTQGVDIICHAAASSPFHCSGLESSRQYLHHSMSLLVYAKMSGVSRFVNISTVSAAGPAHNQDPYAIGVPKRYWPHLTNMVAVENLLRSFCDDNFTGVNLRLGLFAGNRHSLGLLPMLIPGLKSALMPWVQGGNTGLPVTSARDIARAFFGAVISEHLQYYNSFNIVGPQVPSAREVIHYLSSRYQLPKPKFSLPTRLAFRYAHIIEWLGMKLGFRPPLTRSLVHLLNSGAVDNSCAIRHLGYLPSINWRHAIDEHMDWLDAVNTAKLRAQGARA